MRQPAKSHPEVPAPSSRSEFEYNLILATDYNTNGHTQWYFFSVANTRKNVEYRFNIINLLKPDSLYNVGMKPLVYSERAALARGVGWIREGGDICYYTNNMKRKFGGYYSNLCFTLKFERKRYARQTTTIRSILRIAIPTPTRVCRNI